MTVQIKLKDVGGLKGLHEYKLKNGKVNLIESSNSSGKSSIVKGLLGVLSISDYALKDDYFQDEADKLGVKTDQRSQKDGFVNIHANNASVEMNYNDFNEIYSIKSNGEYIKLPKKANEKFLLSGIISNDSKIIRQLHGMDDKDPEPGNFRWAVNNLSYAIGYDKAEELLKTLKEEIDDNIHNTEQKIGRIKEISARKNKHLNDVNIIERDLKQLKGKFKGQDKILERREKERDIIKKAMKSRTEQENSLDQNRTLLNETKAEYPKLETKLSQLRKDVKQIDIDKIQREAEEKIKNIWSGIEEFKIKRAENDVMVNILVAAKVSVSKEKGKIECPLCENGNISLDHLDKRLETYRFEKDKVGGEILSLSEEIDKIKRERDGLEEKQNEIEEQISDLRNRLLGRKEEIEGKERAEAQLNKKIIEYNSVIKKAENELSQLKISTGSEKDKEELQRLETRFGELNTRVSDITKELAGASIEFKGHFIEPGDALKIYKTQLNTVEKWVAYTQEEAEKQRRLASKKFNENISNLMNELKFKEFRSIKLNEDYRLYVERLNSKTGDYVFQQVETLSTSEKLAIALILQLSLKETYIPEIPFFIVDDILEDLDDERRNTVLSYLNKKAQENNWYVIVTKLSQKNGSPVISQWAG